MNFFIIWALLPGLALGDFLPHAAETDLIEVHYLQAPLLAGKFGPTLGFLDMFHMGIGTVNLLNDERYTFEFCAKEFIHTLFPVVQPDNTLIWHNEGLATVTPGINMTYWISLDVVIATINGTQFNQLIEWFKNTPKTYPYYQMYQAWTKYPHGHEWIPSVTCSDYVYDMVVALKNFGVVYSPTLELGKNVVFYASDKPEIVDPNDPTTKEDMAKFFRHFQFDGEGPGTFVEFMLGALTVMDGHAYLYSDGTYYRLHTHFPFFQQTYTKFRPAEI